MYNINKIHKIILQKSKTDLAPFHCESDGGPKPAHSIYVSTQTMYYRTQQIIDLFYILFSNFYSVSQTLSSRLVTDNNKHLSMNMDGTE